MCGGLAPPAAVGIWKYSPWTKSSSTNGNFTEKTLEAKGKGKEDERTRMVDEVKKLKDEQALLSEKAKAEKQGAIDMKIKTLQEECPIKKR